MAPLLQRSPGTEITYTYPTSASTTGTPTPVITIQEDFVSPRTLSLSSILALSFGILFALLLAISIFILARKRQQRSRAPAPPKSMAQANFFDKLAADQRAAEEGVLSEKGSGGGRVDEVWGRNSFAYAAPTGREGRRPVMEDPGKVWVIKPIEPAALPLGR